jgi:hypothetical protein
MIHLRKASIVLPLLVMLALSGRPTKALADPGLVITPASGSAFDYFDVDGSGFAPGAVLKVTFSDMSGASYNLVDADGNNKAVIAKQDGSFDLDLQPSNDLKTTTPGTWKVRVCSGDTCFAADLTLTSSSSAPGYGGGGDGGMGGGGGGGGGGYGY